MRPALVSIAGSNPTVFQTVSFQQVSPLPLCLQRGADSQSAVSALMPTPFFYCETSALKSGGAARKSARATSLQATFSRNQSGGLIR